jgi:pimeloyl-ACP methyl ester carboxylesterase
VIVGIHDRTALVGGLPVHYWEAGEENGRALLLLSGGIGDAELNWQAVIPQLAETYHLLAPDLPSYSGSAALPVMSVEALVEWLHSFLNALNVEQAVVIGSSLGALVARLFAAAYPQHTPAIILINGGAIPHTPPLIKALARIPGASSLLFQMMGRSATSSSSLGGMFFAKGLVTDAFVQRSQATAPNFARLMRGMLAYPIPPEQTPAVPTLLLWGANDAMATLEDAEALHKAIPGSRLAQIADCGHLPQLEAADVFVYQVDYFLDHITRPPKADLPGVAMLTPK